VLGEEVYEGRLGVQTEGVIGEVDGVEFGEREEGGKEVRERLRDLREQSSGEDIGEVGDLYTLR